MADVIVETPSGCLRGTSRTSSESDIYIEFKGIPYARPPVGQLRFKDPEPLEAWKGILNAKNHGPVCPQMDPVTKKIQGSEDCLYLNIYTRNVKNRSPVLFWIHGGAFISGSGDDDKFGPDYFMTKDVVLVTINYRLGVLGFLNLQDELAPGNQGLKDQVMALKWIKSNVSYFGGDPDNITIFGGSAGAASVHYISISPLAKDLFHKAICQSGNALCPWALKQEPRKNLQEFLSILGCKEKDSKGIFNYLRNIDYNKLIEAQEKLITPQRLLQCDFPFGPGLDYKSKQPFMPINLSQAIDEGIQVPLIIGWNSLECIFLANVFKAINKKDMNDNLEKYLPPHVSEMLKKYGLTLSDLKKLYFDDDDISDNNLNKILELWSDLIFIESIHILEKIQYNNSAAPTYLYKLSYDKNITINKKMHNIPGVSHGDELTYLFKSKEYDAMNIKQLQDDTGAKRVMNQMIDLWTNFSKIGRPTPFTSELIPTYWQPLLSDVVLRYLNIGDELRVEQALNIEQRYSFKKNKQRIEQY